MAEKKRKKKQDTAYRKESNAKFHKPTLPEGVSVYGTFALLMILDFCLAF